MASFDSENFDIYLLSNALLTEETVAVERDPRAGFDRAASFSRLDASLRGCSLDAAVTRQVLRAIAFRTTPAMDPGTANGTAASLANLMSPCSWSSETTPIAIAQSHADRAINDTSLTEAGSSLFFGWIDQAFAQSPGATIVAEWALAATRTEGRALRWASSPSPFDVLKTSFKDALFIGSTVEDLFAGYGVGRAFVGSLADDAHFIESRTLGESVRIALAWDIPWPTSPRRLAAPLPLAPTGSAYLKVHVGDAPKGSALRIEPAWEQLMRLRWTVVKIAADGHEIARIPIAAPPKATDARLSVENLDGVDALLIVATNVGDWENGFVADQLVWEPHGYLVTVAPE